MVKAKTVILFHLDPGKKIADTNAVEPIERDLKAVRVLKSDNISTQ